jgi:hypothetical protein
MKSAGKMYRLSLRRIRRPTALSLRDWIAACFAAGREELQALQ